jgi:3-hydroxyisobutyrate dehydrogenase-like beta-hydroxyacid dehydrogenase
LTRITVFGLGEAGSEVTTPEGVKRFDKPENAVVDADVVLGITAQADAQEAICQAINYIDKSSLYADLSTSSAALKRQLADIAVSHGFDFVDIALMTLVPGNGLRTHALASGQGAERFVSIFKPLGMPVETISQVPGDAATRKLLRSVMMKGLASLVIEAMRAGYAAGCEDWLWNNMAEQLTAADEKMLARLVTGTGVHALRRLHEMEASMSLLQDLDVDPVMTRATVESHRHILEQGVPGIPEHG